jgi:hypothetical protein
VSGGTVDFAIRLRDHSTLRRAAHAPALSAEPPLGSRDSRSGPAGGYSRAVATARAVPSLAEGALGVAALAPGAGWAFRRAQVLATRARKAAG